MMHLRRILPVAVTSFLGLASGASNGDPAGLSVAAAQGQKSEVIPPDLGQVEQMCALLTGCDRLPIPPSLVPERFKVCVTKMADELAAPGALSSSLLLRECGLQADSCAALRTCALRGANPGACTGRGKEGVVGFCDVDGRGITCWHEQVLAVRDCPRGGEQCSVVDGQATCSLGRCPEGTKDGDPPRCSASKTHILRCEKGKLASLDCAAFGLTCATSTKSVPACQTSGASCTGPAKRCDDGAAVACHDGHEVRVDCARSGLACAWQDGATAVGSCYALRPAMAACDPGAAAVCDGPNIDYCYGGKRRSYFCKALGFNRCDDGPTGPHCAM